MLFDLRSPGHYLRRLKTVSLSLPCVVGPHTAVHARLTLLRSHVRRSATATGAYPRVDDDNRFADDFALEETVVTSGTVEAPGVWEPALAAERRMPYEGRGALSTWRIELPREFPAFDYATIADAIPTMRYSAGKGALNFVAPRWGHCSPGRPLVLPTCRIDRLSGPRRKFFGSNHAARQAPTETRSCPAEAPPYPEQALDCPAASDQQQTERSSVV